MSQHALERVSQLTTHKTQTKNKTSSLHFPKKTHVDVVKASFDSSLKIWAFARQMGEKMNDNCGRIIIIWENYLPLTHSCMFCCLWGGEIPNNPPIIRCIINASHSNQPLGLLLHSLLTSTNPLWWPLSLVLVVMNRFRSVSISLACTIWKYQHFSLSITPQHSRSNFVLDHASQIYAHLVKEVWRGGYHTSLSH